MKFSPQVLLFTDRQLGISLFPWQPWLFAMNQQATVPCPTYNNKSATVQQKHSHHKHIFMATQYCPHITTYWQQEVASSDRSLFIGYLLTVSH